MKKYNYTVSIEAPSKEIADMLMEYICKDNYDLLELMQKAEEEKIQEPVSNGKEAMTKGLMDFQKVIQIIVHCMTDETALDRIADILGITNPKTAKQK